MRKRYDMCSGEGEVKFRIAGYEEYETCVTRFFCQYVYGDIKVICGTQRNCVDDLERETMSVMRMWGESNVETIDICVWLHFL